MTTFAQPRDLSAGRGCRASLCLLRRLERLFCRLVDDADGGEDSSAVRLMWTRTNAAAQGKNSVAQGWGRMSQPTRRCDNCWYKRVSKVLVRGAGSAGSMLRATHLNDLAVDDNFVQDHVCFLDVEHDLCFVKSCRQPKAHVNTVRSRQRTPMVRNMG